jgi:hypothetical protein
MSEDQQPARDDQQPSTQTGGATHPAVGPGGRVGGGSWLVLVGWPRPRWSVLAAGGWVPNR